MFNDQIKAQKKFKCKNYVTFLGVSLKKPSLWFESEFSTVYSRDLSCSLNWTIVCLNNDGFKIQFKNYLQNKGINLLVI